MTKFKVGDKVKRIIKSDSPKFWGVVGEVYTILSITETGQIQVIDKELTFGDIKTADPEYFELVREYEDSWILNDGKTTIPEDAKILKDTTGTL